MLINDNSRVIKKISGIHRCDMELIRAFLQGAVYCWIKNKKDKSFEFRSLMGGDNANWVNTPLQVFYEKHKKSGKNNENANTTAGQDAGKILKSVLKDDYRKFKVSKGFVKSYEWVK